MHGLETIIAMNNREVADYERRRDEILLRELTSLASEATPIDALKHRLEELGRPSEAETVPAANAHREPSLELKNASWWKLADVMRLIYGDSSAKRLRIGRSATRIIVTVPNRVSDEVITKLDIIHAGLQRSWEYVRTPGVQNVSNAHVTPGLPKNIHHSDAATTKGKRVSAVVELFEVLVEASKETLVEHSCDL